ncbi:hypothetical protein [Streptomyces sp. NPDC058252]|uniref:hypothetical protein n=1 Tax=Streptomyces sp. NPDC058252 TaxID=3346405 RepID=UPI0036EE11DE
MNRVSAASTATHGTTQPTVSASDSAVQVRAAEAVTSTEQPVRLVIEAEIFTDPDGGPDSLIVTTDTLACEPTSPARLLDMVTDARTQLDQIERMARIYEAEAALRTILAENRLALEEWDTATLSPLLRDHLAVFCILDEGLRVVVVPKGQDPVERVTEVARLIAYLKARA